MPSASHGVPGWASDYTHNGNVPSAIAANLMGNMPELMLAYTTYIESIVPWLEINAKHLFGARGKPNRQHVHIEVGQIVRIRLP